MIYDYGGPDDPLAKLGYCIFCGCNVQSVTIDEGFDHEFGFESRPTDVCPECGERVSEPKYEEENES